MSCQKCNIQQEKNFTIFGRYTLILKQHVPSVKNWISLRILQPDQYVLFGQRSSGEDCSDCADAQADLNLH